MKKVELFLKKLGVKPETITELLEDKDVNIDELETEVKENYKGILKNDSSFIDPLHVEVTGKVRGSLETKMARLFGISTEELEAMDKNKRVDGILDRIKGDLDKKKSDVSTDDKDKEIEKLNKRLLKYQDDMKKVREEEIPSIENKYKGEMKAIKFGSILEGEVANNKIVEGISKKVAALSVREKLSAIADFDFDENGGLVLKQKGKDLDLYVDNNKATLSGLVSKYLEEDGLIQKQNPTEKKEFKFERKENDVSLTPGANAAADRAAAMKAKLKK